MHQSLEIKGTDVALNDLLQLQLLVNDLQVLGKSRVHSYRKGDQRSVFKGQGREFAEMKHYWPGDDARQIDWRQTAKKQTPFVRIMEEDRHAQQAVWLDLTASSYFGTRRCFKSVMACHWAAFLVWRFLHLHHPVRFLVRVGSEWQQELNLLNQRDGARACELIATAHQYLANNFASLQPANSANILHWRGKPNLWFISDFMQTPAENLNAEIPVNLFNSVSLLQAADAFDSKLPEAGALPVTHKNLTGYIDTAGKQTQQSYRALAEQREQSLQEFAWQRGGVFHKHLNENFQWQEVLAWPLYH